MHADRHGRRPLARNAVDEPEAGRDAIVAADPQGKIVFILRDDTERWKLEHGK
ncbi:MAG TPA: hypothetical protein VFZ84_22870 [Burkholderiales bacterium]